MHTWTPILIGGTPYATITEDTHFGQWQRIQPRGFIDRQVVGQMLEHVPAGCVAIDGGAFNGETAIAIAERAGLVWAFEPQLPLFLNLCANVFNGRHGNVIPVHAALGETDGYTKTEAWRGEPDNYGARRLGYGDVQVDVVALCTHRATQERIGFIKLDVEGWEVDALRGARSAIARDRPVLWFEVNRGALEARRRSPHELLHLVEGMGYSVRAVTGREGGDQWDALAVPR